MRLIALTTFMYSRIKGLILIFLASVWLPALSYAGQASVLGFWLTSESVVEVKICGEDICATIEQIFVGDDGDPLAILDEKNKDATLRTRALIGVNLFDGFDHTQAQQKKLKGGSVYNPRDGRFYDGKLNLLKNGHLKVQGCVLFLCDGEEWKPLDVSVNPNGTREAILGKK
jgi:uncharacterized protein (DUF2147 family)